jgi:hypothetical protein
VRGGVFCGRQKFQTQNRDGKLGCLKSWGFSPQLAKAAARLPEVWNCFQCRLSRKESIFCINSCNSDIAFISGPILQQSYRMRPLAIPVPQSQSGKIKYIPISTPRPCFVSSRPHPLHTRRRRARHSIWPVSARSFDNTKSPGSSPHNPVRFSLSPRVLDLYKIVPRDFTET